MSRTMKPEIIYDDVVILQLIDDLMTDTERNMDGLNTKDPYFTQLSLEKYALGEIFDAIANSGYDYSAFDCVEQFYSKMDEIVDSEPDPDVNYLFSVARDMAMLIISNIEGWPWDP